MPHEAQIIGAARSELSDEEYRDIVRAAIAEFGAIDHSDNDVDEFLSRVSISMWMPRGRQVGPR